MQAGQELKAAMSGVCDLDIVVPTAMWGRQEFDGLCDPSVLMPPCDGALLTELPLADKAAPFAHAGVKPNAGEAGSPDSGSCLTGCGPVAVKLEDGAEPLPAAAAVPVKGDKELEAFLDWDGALLDLGLELDAFENEIMHNSLTKDAIVPIIEPAESSCGSDCAPGSDGFGDPAAVAGAQAVPGVAVPPMAHYPVPQYAMAMQMNAAGWAVYGQAYGMRPDQLSAREARHRSIKRYREKRQRRIFEKTIRYQSRKAYAEIRPRIKGRFAKRDDATGGGDAPRSPVHPCDELVVPTCA